MLNNVATVVQSVIQIIKSGFRIKCYGSDLLKIYFK